MECNDKNKNSACIVYLNLMHFETVKSVENLKKNYLDTLIIEVGSKNQVYISLVNSQNILNTKIQIYQMNQCAKLASLSQMSSVGVVQIDRIAHVVIPVTSIRLTDTQCAVEIDVRHLISYYLHFNRKITF